MGYCGGSSPAPTYHDLADHSEAIEVDFDPRLVDYGDLLELFFASHNPRRTSYKRQYRSAIFYADERQRRSAERAMDAQVRAGGSALSTALEPHTGFTLAEDYHQKYVLRGAPDLLAELQALYPARDAFLASTAVTRANAFRGGHGSEQRRLEDVPRMGLSERAADQLLR